jgi:tryptophan synthase alpha chain
VSAVAGAFGRAAGQNRAALVGYLPAGFPTVDGAISAVLAMVAAGADVIEIGLPYSDPLMDGPVIQEAVHRALTGGVRVADVLRTVEAVAAAGLPVLVMTYWNPVDHYGVRAFARDLASAGGSGMITPDLTPEEAQPWLQAAAEHRLDPVFLVAPSSSDERLALITAACGGFVYAASLMGTTGARASVGSAASGSAPIPACRSRSAWGSATGPRPPRWPASRMASSSGLRSWRGCWPLRTWPPPSRRSASWPLSYPPGCAAARRQSPDQRGGRPSAAPAATGAGPAGRSYQAPR